MPPSPALPPPRLRVCASACAASACAAFAHATFACAGGAGHREVDEPARGETHESVAPHRHPVGATLEAMLQAHLAYGLVVRDAYIGHDGDADAVINVVDHRAPPVDLDRDGRTHAVQAQHRVLDLSGVAPGARHDHGMVRQRPDGDLLVLAERMVLRRDDHGVGLRDRVELQVARHDVEGRDDDVELEAAQPCKPFAAGAGAQLHVRAGMARLVPAHQIGQHVARRDLSGAHAQRLGGVAGVKLVEELGQAQQPLDQRPDQSEEVLADARRRGAPAHATKERHAKLLFEPLHERRHRGLARLQRLRRVRDAARLHHLAERPQLPEAVAARGGLCLRAHSHRHDARRAACSEEGAGAFEISISRKRWAEGVSSRSRSVNTP